MADKANNIIVTGATALYPRLNQTYKFIENNGKKERVSCDPSDDGAEYTLNLVLTKAQAVPLYKAMKNAYEAGKQTKWASYPSHEELFEVTDNGEYIAKTKLKGWYNGEATSITQFDASNNVLPKDFMLTTGSKVNVLLGLIVYDPTHIAGHGVSLRLRQIQVVELKEMSQRSAFDAVEGGFNSQADGFATSFETPTTGAAEVAEEVEAPTPKPKKAEPVAKTETKAVEEFNDIDDALDNLEFEDA